MAPSKQGLGGLCPKRKDLYKCDQWNSTQQCLTLHIHFVLQHTIHPRPSRNPVTWTLAWQAPWIMEKLFWLRFAYIVLTLPLGLCILDVFIRKHSDILSLQEADLVTTHELGHNFGAEHDPDNIADCAPNDDQGGKFVMYPIAVSGDHANNKVLLSILCWLFPLTYSYFFLLTYCFPQRFSSCSRFSISKTLKIKAQQCFKERSSKLCGNSRVEEDEDCDPGLLHLNDDPCCTAKCKFKKNALCR